MDIKERVVGGVSILDLSGKVVLGEGDLQVKERIKDLLADGQKRILLNLAEVNYIDSAGLDHSSVPTRPRNAKAEV